MAIVAATLPTPVLNALRRRQAHQPAPGSRVPPYLPPKPPPVAEPATPTWVRELPIRG